MRHLTGVLYLLTALVGLYWALWWTFTGLYGVPFSLWYVVIFMGVLVQLVGAILWWASTSSWTRWVPVVGSLLLASLFVPAGVGMLRDYYGTKVRGGAQLAIPLISVALVLASLVTAIINRIGYVGDHSAR
jgi:hypothetical protein